MGEFGIRQWYRNKIGEMKLRLMARWSKQAGLTVCKIITKAGTDYILNPHDGSLRKIGRSK